MKKDHWKTTSNIIPTEFCYQICCRLVPSTPLSIGPLKFTFTWFKTRLAGKGIEQWGIQNKENSSRFVWMSQCCEHKLRRVFHHNNFNGPAGNESAFRWSLVCETGMGGKWSIVGRVLEKLYGTLPPKMFGDYPHPPGICSILKEADSLLQMVQSK